MKDKRRLWQIWKNGGREEDILAKKLAWQRVFATKKKAGKEKMKDIETDTYTFYHTELELRFHDSWITNQVLGHANQKFGKLPFFTNCFIWNTMSLK